MKIFSTFIFVILGLSVMGQECWAEKRYVTDSFKITMRTGPSVKNKIIVMLRSGEALEVIETKDDWSRVRRLKRKGDESEGWIMSRYLVSRLPWKDQTENLKNENHELKTKISHLEKIWRETGSREKEASKGLKETSSKFNELKYKYQALKKGSANYVKLKKVYDSTASALRESQRSVERLANENRILKASQRNKWFGMGALILLCGLLIGIAMGKFQKKQKTNIIY